MNASARAPPPPSRKTLGKFSTVCYGCSWRSDGRLIAAGDGFGYVHVIDATSGAVLRKLGDAKKQGAAIRTTTWAEEGSKLVSGGDDGGISIWDVTLGERIVSNSSAHKAEVRSVLSCGRSAWLTAGLDGVVKVWDERTSRESFVLDHGAPVESAATKGSELAVSAGGHDVVLWDLAMRRRGYAFSEAHAKACACVVFTSAGRRIISAGADGIVKAHSLADWSTSRVARFDEPVLCVACSHEDLLLAAGTAAGRLELRCRSEPSKPLKSRHRTLTPPPGTYRHFQRGKAFEPKPGDHIIYVAPPSQKKPKLHPYDEALRKFRYGDALDAALATRDPNIVVAVLAELNRRGGLRTAVDNRDEDRLETLLFFLASYIANPRYALRLTKVVHVALDIYRPILGVNPAIDELFQKIALKVKLEADNQRESTQIIACPTKKKAAIRHRSQELCCASRGPCAQSRLLPQGLMHRLVTHGNKYRKPTNLSVMERLFCPAYNKGVG